MRDKRLEKNKYVSKYAKKMSDKEMEQMRQVLEKSITKKYKTPLHKKLYEYFELLGVFVLIVLFACMVLFVLVYLIENPVSLAIICGTALLFFMWGKR